LPYADTEAMRLHLDEISRHVAKGAYAVLPLDRAGWHTTGNLDMPENITPIFLPSRAPELNPVENVWQYLRSNWLSNRVFDTYDAIIDPACEAWMNLMQMPNTLTSIAMRSCAHIVIIQGFQCAPNPQQRLFLRDAFQQFRRRFIVEVLRH
jgi:transposase